MLKKLFLLTGLASPALALAQVNGLYGGECVSLDGLSAVKDVYFTPDSFEMVQTVFTDAGCQNPAYDFSVSGTYSFDPNTSAIDFHFEAMRMTAIDDRVATTFAEEHLCGLEDWRAHAALDVSGRDCAGQTIPQHNSVAYDILALSGEGIRFGKLEPEHDGSTPGKRTRTWDTAFYSAK